MPIKVLIIEDNDQDQKIIRRFLTKAGFEDLTFIDNGEQGVDMAARLMPDIVITDTMLPGIDGFEVCRRIKKEKKLPAAVIVMTGRIDAVDAHKAREQGADDYCVKTSDYAALVESVRKKVSGQTSGAVPGAPADVREPLLQQISDGDWGSQKTKDGIRALYRELEQKNEELKELDRLKSEFVSTVSHELRTPLTIIKGAAGQMLEGLYGPVAEEQKKKLAMVVRNADLLRRIIEDLLDIAKLEAKKVVLNKRDIDVAEVAAEVFHSFEGMAAAKNIKLALTLSQEPVIAHADRDRIQQVFTNLMSNALKFTDEGSITVAVRRQDGRVEIVVQDTGCGISPEDLPKVFDRFQQFGKRFGPGQEGTGLGLSICKSIVELHNGNITVESRPQKGTKFIFTLPN